MPPVRATWPCSDISGPGGDEPAKPKLQRALLPSSFPRPPPRFPQPSKGEGSRRSFGPVATAAPISLDLPVTRGGLWESTPCAWAHLSVRQVHITWREWTKKLEFSGIRVLVLKEFAQPLKSACLELPVRVSSFHSLQRGGCVGGGHSWGHPLQSSLERAPDRW